jgi:hypothetical protein
MHIPPSSPEAEMVVPLDKQPLYSKLKGYGLPVEDQEELDRAAETIDSVLKDEAELVFVETPTERETALDFWDAAFLYKHMAACGVEGQLEPFVVGFLCIRRTSVVSEAGQELLGLEARLSERGVERRAKKNWISLDGYL